MKNLINMHKKNDEDPHFAIIAEARVANQCCGAVAGGAEIIWDLEPEPKLNL